MSCRSADALISAGKTQLLLLQHRTSPRKPRVRLIHDLISPHLMRSDDLVIGRRMRQSAASCLMERIDRIVLCRKEVLALLSALIGMGAACAAHARKPDVDADALSAVSLPAVPGAGSNHVSLAGDATPPASVQFASYELPANARRDAVTGVLFGTASWYGKAWKGRRTASGSRFNPEALTAASGVLPLGARVWVTLEGTARSVLVTVTDKQADARRLIDLSLAAARRIGMVGRGTARVSLRPVG